MKRTTFVLRTQLRNVVTCVSAAILAVVMLFPLTIESQGRTYNFSREHARDTLDALSSVSYEGAPQELLNSIQQERNALLDALSSKDDAEYLAKLADYYDLIIQEYDAGYVDGDRLNYVYLASYARELSQESDVNLYDSLQEEPALYYLVNAYTILPGVLWLIPAALAVLEVAKEMGSLQIVGNLPGSKIRWFIDAWLSATTLALLELLVALVPAFIIVGIRNGIGSVSYPVLLLQGNSLVQSSIGGQLLGILLLSLSGFLFLTCVGCALALILSNASLAVILPALLSLVPSVPNMLSANAPSVGRAPWLPLGYLRIAEIVGRPQYAIGEDYMTGGRLTVSGGVSALALWSCIVLAIVAFGSFLQERKASSRPASSRESLVLWNGTIGHRRAVLFSNSNLVIDAGSSVGLIAPNGAGKTTLLEALAGSRRCLLHGSVWANGTMSNEAKYGYRVLYVPGEGSALTASATVREHLELVQRAWHSPLSTEQVAKECGLVDLLDRKARTLSQGMRQQAAVAIARMSCVDYVLLDEPMNALDPQKTRLLTELFHTMHREGTCVVMSSHLLENVDEICDQAILLTASGPELVPLEQSARKLFEETYGM